MNQTETAELLRVRRELTGQTFNDDTINAWHTVLADADYQHARDALLTASRTEKRITVAHVVEQLPARKERPTGNHPTSCMCSGRGWIEIEQHDDVGSWSAWDRCPNGSRTGFVEVDA